MREEYFSVWEELDIALITPSIYIEYIYIYTRWTWSKLIRREYILIITEEIIGLNNWLDLAKRIIDWNYTLSHYISTNLAKYYSDTVLHIYFKFII